MLEKRINGSNVLLTWGVFLSFGIYLFIFGVYKDVKSFSQNAEMPEEKFGFSSEYFYSFLEKIGDAGQTAYFNFQLLDFINLLLLGSALFISIYYFLNKVEVQSIFKIVLVLPIIFVIIDFSEDILIIYLLSNLPDKLDSIVAFTSLLTKAKLICVGLAFLSMLISGIVWLLKILHKNLSNNQNE